MSMILSHTTAQLYHRLPNIRTNRALLPPEPTDLRCGAADTTLARRARQLLIGLGAPPEEVSSLDVLVARDRDRRVGRGIHAHVWGFPIPASSLVPIDRGLYVTNALFTAQLMARKTDERGLIEYLMELCSWYGLAPSGGQYDVRAPLVQPADIENWSRSVCGQHGARKLRQALKWVRGGARSPMETAFFMMMLLPRRLGGLQIDGLELAHRIRVEGAACALTRRSYFECDAYLPSSRTDFEYNGLIHETEEQFTIDAERMNALDAMGYNMMVITRREFFDRQAFLRLMCAIERRTGKRVDREPDGFRDRQEDLRRFVLRRYLPNG